MKFNTFRFHRRKITIFLCNFVRYNSFPYMAITDGKEEISIEERHSIILDMMKEVDKFCRDNNIRYSISDGTMLGAVRHGGFIPWDDDADFLMPREDFDRFASTFKSERFRMHYLPDQNDGFTAMGYIKLSDPGTSIIRHKKNRTTIGNGVYMDIFPLDAMPADKKKRRRHIHEIMRIHNRLYTRHQKNFHSYLKTYWRSKQGWWDKLMALTHSGEFDGSGWAALAIGTRRFDISLPTKWFDEFKEYEFEGHKFMGFGNAASYLTVVFGPDYMTPVKWSHKELVVRNTPDKEEKSE